MQYELPRYIEEEAKVFGPLSLKQFMIAFAGIMACALLFFFLQTWLAAILSVILMSGAIFLMLGKIQGRPASAVVLGAIKHFWSPKVFVWQKPVFGSEQVYVETLKKEKEKTEAPELKTPQIVSKQKIAELAKQLDKKE
jgi:hypothetical protein